RTPTFWAAPCSGFSHTTYVDASSNTFAGWARCSTSTFTLVLPSFSAATFTLPCAEGILSVVFIDQVDSFVRIVPQPPKASVPASAPATPQRLRFRICMWTPLCEAGALAGPDKRAASRPGQNQESTFLLDQDTWHAGPRSRRPV